MNLYRFLWFLIALNESLSVLMVPFWSLWVLKGPGLYGSLWVFIGPSGSSWVLMGRYWSLWVLVRPYGSLWVLSCAYGS